MVELKLQECDFPVRSIQGALELLEKLKWFLSYKEFDGRIVLFRGTGRSSARTQKMHSTLLWWVPQWLTIHSPIQCLKQFKASMDVPHWQRHIFPGLIPLQE